MFVETRADSGTAISVEWATKAFNQKAFMKFKKYYDPTFQFKSVSTSGALSGDIIVDGVTVTSTFTINQQSTGGAGFGTYLFGFHLFGDAPNSTDVNASISSDLIVQVKIVKIARSIKYKFRSNSATARYKFLSLNNTFALLNGKRLPSSSITYVT